mmetsp:Transcript_44798/g.117505  ORF Transcript_44798/g.117505 Transcript_44798/m.117505 type:complete len:230 (-) Transcript_44798:150-839(-)
MGVEMLVCAPSMRPHSSLVSTAVSSMACRVAKILRLSKNSAHDLSARFAALRSLSSCTLMRTSLQSASEPRESSSHSASPTSQLTDAAVAWVPPATNTSSAWKIVPLSCLLRSAMAVRFSSKLIDVRTRCRASSSASGLRNCTRSRHSTSTHCACIVDISSSSLISSAPCTASSSPTLALSAFGAPSRPVLLLLPVLRCVIALRYTSAAVRKEFTAALGTVSSPPSVVD